VLPQLFQLRSIEQNELAVIADSQNKAIFVFTGVTLIFLPLSFFTSYYGMNIQGIVDTNMNVDDFWRLSATLTFGILTLISLYAFRDRIRLQLVRIGRSHHLL
jgi:Mg2+ and Co2+ transporter CorA